MTSDILTEIADRIDEFARMPGGMEQLRRTLMTAAFTGKLVPHQVNADSVDLLLEELAAERQSGKDHRRRRVSNTKPNRPWELPATWRWARLGDCVSRIEYGYTAPAESAGGGGPHMVRITDLKADGIDWDTVPFCTISTDGEAKYRLAPGDLLFARTGGTVGKSHLYQDNQRTVFASYLIRLRALLAINVEYLYLWSKSPDYWRQIYAGVTGTGQPNFNGEKLAALVIPLPPRSEQDTIVAELSDLLEHLDSLDTALAVEEQYRGFLCKAAFRKLGTDRNRLALDHLGMLIREESDVQQLESAVLQLAVRGQLTTARDADEPVESLLAQARASSLDAPDPFDSMGSSWDIPYELPVGWQWVVLGSMLTDIQAGWSPAAQTRPKEGDEWGVLKVSACSWGEFRSGENKALQPGQTPRPALEVKAGNFLISRANTAELVGRSVVVHATPPHLMLSDKTLRMKVVDGCNARYLNLANLSQVAREHYEREATGTSRSMKNVSQRIIRRTPIPLPPREEQDRIVMVVDELMALLHRLRVELAV